MVSSQILCSNDFVTFVTYKLKVIKVLYLVQVYTHGGTHVGRW